ncbi:unnamed protein product [Rotaria sordida]|uniref:Uncharacterized protein n=1 Tax=Rotaria sordida TaxID=392033 RepID=A0A819IPV0_9BILA|nr:unnamed protein product [Rotaria sordida]CAF3916969.1 unnamed protein product [Rotaria sordida]
MRKELILLEDPSLLDNFLEEVLDFQTDKSPEVRKTIISFIEEACSIDNLTKECLGFVEDVYEQVLGEGKYTFVQGWKDSRSVTKVQQYIY